MRQGHDVTLMPLYTPTLTDEPNVSQTGFFSAASACIWSSTGRCFVRLLGCSTAVGFEVRAEGRGQEHHSGRSAFSGRDDGFDARSGERTFEERVEKMLEWLRTEPRPDVINLPYTLLIGLAGPLKRALGAPVCCTLQGEDLFLEGLTEPYRIASARPDTQKHSARGLFFGGQRLLRRISCADTWEFRSHKMEIARVGVNTEGYREAPGASAAKVRLRIGYFARIAPEKGLHVLAEAYRIVTRAGAELHARSGRVHGA